MLSGALSFSLGFLEEACCIDTLSSHFRGFQNPHIREGVLSPSWQIASVPAMQVAKHIA
jgi:hypothetical protein